MIASLRRVRPGWVLLSLTAAFVLSVVPLADLRSTEAYVGGTTAWTERQPAGDNNRNWLGVASSSDGTKLIAGIGSTLNGRLYTSSDSGANWVERQPAGDTNKWWRDVASSADGTKLAAMVNGGRLYTSSDSGANWVERQPAGATNKNWTRVDMSADGSILIASAYGGRLYTSSDSGANWVERQPLGDTNQNWDPVAVSANGSVMAAAVYGGRLFVSTNSGVDWIEQQPGGASNYNWFVLSIDNTGGTILAGVAVGRLYTSSDSGANWVERQPAGATNKNWQAGAVSSDGLKMIAGVSGGRLYSSTDGGINWNEERPAGDANRYWAAVGVSSDGNKIIAGENTNSTTGRLFTGVFTAYEPPEILAPLADTRQKLLNLTVDIKEPALASSITLLMYYGMTGHTLQLEDFSVGQHSITIDTTDVFANPGVNGASSQSIPDNTFDLMLQYQEATTGYYINSALVQNVTIDTTGPVITNTTPSDDAADASGSSNLTLELDEPVVLGTGNFVIKKASDDSIVETIPANDSRITGDGTDTLTINPNTDLVSSMSYYVLADAGLFADDLGNGFLGISDSTTWNFTTASLVTDTTNDLSQNTATDDTNTVESVDIEETTDTTTRSPADETTTNTSRPSAPVPTPIVKTIDKPQTDSPRQWLRVSGLIIGGAFLFILSLLFRLVGRRDIP